MTHIADTPGDGAALALGALVGLALDAWCQPESTIAELN